MRALKIIILIGFTIAFDAFVLWGVDFTIAWAGAVPPLRAFGFWAFAISPVVVTSYCVTKLLAFRGGRSPPI